MLQNRQEVFDEILTEISEYKGETLEEFWADQFTNEERNMYFDDAETDLNNFELDDAEEPIDSGFYTGTVGAIHFVMDRMIQDGYVLDIKEFSNPSKIANYIDNFRSEDVFQELYQDTSLNEDSVINDDVIDKVEDYINNK